MEHSRVTALPVVHRPARPRWHCQSCDAEWPCRPGKAELAAEYADDRVGLLVYLAGLLVDAVQDVGGVPPHLLMDRFVGWAKADDHAGPARPEKAS